jgi:hypothetical protein
MKATPWRPSASDSHAAGAANLQRCNGRQAVGRAADPRDFVVVSVPDRYVFGPAGR